MVNTNTIQNTDEHCYLSKNITYSHTVWNPKKTNIHPKRTRMINNVISANIHICTWTHGTNNLSLLFSPQIYPVSICNKLFIDSIAFAFSRHTWLCLSCLSWHKRMYYKHAWSAHEQYTSVQSPLQSKGLLLQKIYVYMQHRLVLYKIKWNVIYESTYCWNLFVWQTKMGTSESDM